MAIIEKREDDYIALLNSEGETVAFVNPVKGIDKKELEKALKAKGLQAELRQPSAAPKISL